MAKKVIDPAPIIKELADRCLEAKGLECSILGGVIDRLRAAPGVYNAPYWATEEAYKNGYEAGKKDAVEVEDQELLKAIKMLIKQYDHSKRSDYVHNPVAHALYHTWKQVDERR